MTLKPRAILAGRYPAHIPAVVERALIHLDRGDGRALCRASLQLMQDDGYDPGPATCRRCIERAERLANTRTHCVSWQLRRLDNLRESRRHGHS